ncbi:hypothetical protein DMENIID0001_058130 [Sergentomyia squamirostris]
MDILLSWERKENQFPHGCPIFSIILSSSSSCSPLSVTISQPPIVSMVRLSGEVGGVYVNERKLRRVIKEVGCGWRAKEKKRKLRA